MINLKQEVWSFHNINPVRSDQGVDHFIRKRILATNISRSIKETPTSIPRYPPTSATENIVTCQVKEKITCPQR